MAAQLIIPGCENNFDLKKVSRAQFAKIGDIKKGVVSLHQEIVVLAAHIEALNDAIKEKYPDID